MIAECAADLLAKVQAIPALADTSSLTLGGRATDPGMLKVPLPAAWVSLKADAVDERSQLHSGPGALVAAGQMMIATWAVTVFVPYADDADLLAVQYPLLDAIIAAIHATECEPAGYRWCYVGQKIALVYPDRLAYEQRYTLSFVTQ